MRKDASVPSAGSLVPLGQLVVTEGRILFHEDGVTVWEARDSPKKGQFAEMEEESARQPKC